MRLILVPPRQPPRRGPLTLRRLLSSTPSCSTPSCSTPSCFHSSVNLPPLHSSVLALVVLPLLSASSAPSASAASSATSAVHPPPLHHRPPLPPLLRSRSRHYPQAAIPRPKTAPSPCHFLPLLPPITRNVKLPDRATWHEFRRRPQSPSKTPSKSGKNGNVHLPSQHCHVVWGPTEGRGTPSHPNTSVWRAFRLARLL